MANYEIDTVFTEDSYENPGRFFMEIALTQMPDAYAELTGNPGTGEITGMVRFYSALWTPNLNYSSL